MAEAAGDLAGFSLSLFLFESIDQFDGGEEAGALLVMLDGLYAKRGGDMRLAGTGPTDQHDVVGGRDKVTPVKLLDQGFVDLAAGEVEAGQVAIGREACGLELISHGANLSLGSLRLEQLGEYGNGSLEGRSALLRQFIESLRHAVHLQAAQHDDESAAGGIMSHGAPPSGRHSVRRRPWARWPVPKPAGQ